MTDIDRIFPTRLNFPVAGATIMIEVDARRPGWSYSTPEGGVRQLRARTM